MKEPSLYTSVCAEITRLEPLLAKLTALKAELEGSAAHPSTSPKPSPKHSSYRRARYGEFQQTILGLFQANDHLSNADVRERLTQAHWPSATSKGFNLHVRKTLLRLHSLKKLAQVKDGDSVRYHLPING